MINKMLDKIAAEVIDTLPDGECFISDEFIQKYGELLVKTCAEIAEDLKPYGVSTSVYADNIRKHFGIE